MAVVSAKVVVDVTLFSASLDIVVGVFCTPRFVSSAAALAAVTGRISNPVRCWICRVRSMT